MKKILDKLKRGEHVTIVALGDSNTAETFHTRGRMCWVSYLAEAIFETYGAGVCAMINSGVCATGFETVMGRLERDVYRFKPDLVIVAFGVWGGTGGLAKLDAFKDTMRKVLAAIRDNCGSEILVRTPNPVIAVHGVPLPSGQEVGRPMDNHPFQEYAQAQVEIAREFGCTVVDHYTLWDRKRVPYKHPVACPQELWPRMSDALHPGANGHLAFFRELAPSFEVPQYFPWEEVEMKPA